MSVAVEVVFSCHGNTIAMSHLYTVLHLYTVFILNTNSARSVVTSDRRFLIPALQTLTRFLKT
jgi:hypothetical protein